MESDFKFSIDQRELLERVRLACSRWEGGDLPEAFMSVEGDRLGYLDDLGSLTSRRNIDRQLAILAEETALLTARKDKDKKAVYSLMHQNFRDCLAALHVRNAIESDSSTVPEELHNPLSPFVKGYLAELASDDLLDDVWEANRKASPTNTTVTHNLLGTIDRKRDGNLTTLDWSGMDFTQISLEGYRKGLELSISHHPSRFNGAKVVADSFLLLGHNGAVTSVCFSNDGRLIASGSLDGTVRLWDAMTGNLVITPLGAPGYDFVMAVCISPDGSLIASGSDDGTIRLWDVKRGVLATPPLYGHKDKINCLRFSPDGHLLASGSHDCDVCVWDTKTGMLAMPPLRGHQSGIASVCFSSNGRLLASASTLYGVRVWEVATGGLVSSTFVECLNSLEFVCFSTEGHLLAGGCNEGSVILWDVTADCLVTSTSKSSFGLSEPAICFSINADLIAGGFDDGTIRVWNGSTGDSASAPFGGRGGMVWRLSFSPDGRLLAGGLEDGTVRVWDVTVGDSFVTPREGHGSGTDCVCFSADGRLLASGSNDCAIRIWDVQTGNLVVPPFGKTRSKVVSVCFSPDGRLLASGSDDGIIYVWVVAGGKLKMPPLVGHLGGVEFVCFSPDGCLLASGSEDGTVRVWDVLNEGAILRVEKNLGWVRSACFSPDGRQIATVSSVISGSGVHVFDVANHTPVRKIGSGEYWGLSACFSPDGHHLVVGSGDGYVTACNLITGDCSKTAVFGKFGSLSIRSVLMPASGRLLACGYEEGSMCVLDVVKEKKNTILLEGHWDGCESTCFTPDGLLLADGSNIGALRIWDVATGQVMHTITPLYGFNLFGLDLSLADVANNDKQILRQNGVVFDSLLA